MKDFDQETRCFPAHLPDRQISVARATQRELILEKKWGKKIQMSLQ